MHRIIIGSGPPDSLTAAVEGSVQLGDIVFTPPHDMPTKDVTKEIARLLQLRDEILRK